MRNKKRGNYAAIGEADVGQRVEHQLGNKPRTKMAPDQDEYGDEYVQVSLILVSSSGLPGVHDVDEAEQVSRLQDTHDHTDYR